VAIIGPSGSGKTTLLRVLAGFERPDAGRVEIGGRHVAGDGVWVEPEHRRIGMVFQDGALFPHLTVRGNVAFGATSADRAADCLALVGLSDRAKAYPHELSGGERQRVALARALAADPEVVLLDEPFASLDASLRDALRVQVRSILKQAGTSALLVTHDQAEALSLADTVAVMRDGRIEQVGTPEEVYMSPRSGFVSSFVGDCNSLPVVVRGRRAQLDGLSFELPVKHAIEGPARLDFRPHDISLSDGEDALPLHVTGVYRRGGNWRVEGQVAGSERIIEIDLDATEAPPPIGSELAFAITRVRVFAEAEQDR
jgi:ABC-type sulfate/molybdate transport systems ATPase subunit